MRKLSSMILLLGALMCLSSKGRAQVINFSNSLGCPVTVFIEVRNGPGCGSGCHSQSFVVNPGLSSLSLASTCPGYNDLCIFVTRIGSCSVSGTHMTDACHGSVLSDTGTLTGCCSGPPTWTATWAPLPSSTFSIF